jgi:hypothetical protein
MTLIRSGACWAVITVALYFSGCGDGEGGEGNAVGTGGSATGGSATAAGGAATGGAAAGASATGGSRAGAAATGGSPANESGAGGQLEASAGASNAGAGGAEDIPPSTGGTGGTINVGGSGGGDCFPLAPAEGLVFEGDAYVTSPEDVEALREYSGITGSLEVASGLELDVELPQLRHLGGDLRAESTLLRRFAAPGLETIDGEVWFYLNYDLVGIDLHNLTRVGTRVFIHRNLELRVLQLDALVSAGEMNTANTVEISGNLALPDCYLDLVGERFSFVRSTSPDCSCTRSCGLVEAFCP